MTSTTSFLSGFGQFRRTYLWALKKNAGMTALLAVLLFLANPLPLLISMSNWSSVVREAIPMSRQEYLSTQYGNFVVNIAMALALPLVLLFCIVLCVSLFGYMHRKRSVDLFHALPVGRVPMLTGRWCAGLTAVFAPVVLDLAALWAIGAAYGVSLPAGSRPLPVLLLWMLLMSAAAFTFCMFMAVCTGTTMDTVLSILGVNGGYPLLILCVYAIAGMLLPGFDSGDLSAHSAVLTAFAPFAAAFVAILKTHSVWFLLWWIALTAALFAGSVLLYQRRRSETAEDNFAFPIPKLVIRFILTAVGGLGLGLILNMANGPGFFIGVFAGSAVTHVVVEAIYSRGFRQMKRSFAWYGVFLVAFAAFYGVLCTGLFGYDTRVPEASQVESIEIDPDSYWSSYGTQVIYDENHRSLAKLSPTIRDEQNIETVIGLQKQIIGTYRAQFPYRIKSNLGSGLMLSYRMKDGSVVERTYQSYSDDMNLEKILRPAYDTLGAMREFNENRDLIFYLQPEDIKSVDVSVLKAESRTFVPDADTAKELQQALEQDFVDRKVNLYNTTYPEVSVSRTVLGETAVAVASQANVLSLNLEFREDIEPKDARLKALLGGYEGRINLGGGGYYQFADESAQTVQLLKRLGYAQ